MAEAFERLEQTQRWLPIWFKFDFVTRILDYLLEILSGTDLEDSFRRGMSGKIDCHVEVVTSVTGERRVFIGPLGCAGMPVDGRGAANFHWIGSEQPGSRQVVVTLWS